MRTIIGTALLALCASTASAQGAKNTELLRRVLTTSPCIRLQNLTLNEQTFADRPELQRIWIGVLAGMALRDSADLDEIAARMDILTGVLIAHCLTEPGDTAIEVFGRGP